MLTTEECSMRKRKKKCGGRVEYNPSLRYTQPPDFQSPKSPQPDFSWEAGFHITLGEFWSASAPSLIWIGLIAYARFFFACHALVAIMRSDPRWPFARDCRLTSMGVYIYASR